MNYRTLTDEEVAQNLRQTIRQPEVAVRYNSFSEVPHTHAWAEGTHIWIKNGDNYKQHVFFRTGNRPDDGEWHETGVTTTGAVGEW